MGLFLMGEGGQCIVGDDMIAAVIGTVMLNQGTVGMRDGHVVVALLLSRFGSPQQEFQAHHVVNDDRILPNISIEIPGPDYPQLIIVASRQRTGSLQHDLPIGRILGQTVAVAIAAVEHEA